MEAAAVGSREEGEGEFPAVGRTAGAPMPLRGAHRPQSCRGAGRCAGCVLGLCAPMQLEFRQRRFSEFT